MKNNSTNFSAHKQDFSYCETVIKKHSKTFYTAFSQLPKEKAQSVYAVYAFCRRADDLIDLAQDEAQLQVLADQLVDFENGIVADDPIWRALAVVFATFPMDIQPFYDMIAGQRRDIDFKQPKDLAELTEYCYYVAGSVGLMLLPILSSHAAEIQEPAKKLGEAMQITNILRDIGEDYQMGRIYLPQDQLAAFGVTEKMFNNSKPTQALVTVWEELANYAETLYDDSLVMMPLIDADCRPALLAAAMIYREQLSVIREKDYAMLKQRQAVSKIRKLQLLGEVKETLQQMDQVI
ncbi:phytoene/squalene synthase family protein [Enterococcus sp. AZ103]|uniref:phytoene/squalene synthase family protein n=1 Tax=Enterococcus sp. AZ103 TaxID=2774628 RepID=UPI003F22F0D8